MSEHKRAAGLALGRLGWSLRRIEEETGVRRETASGYLRAAGIAVRRVAPDGGAAAKPAITRRCPPTRCHGSDPGAGADRERVRAVSRADRRRAGPRAECDGDLARSRRRPRLHGALRERAALRRAAPRRARRGARDHHDRAGRGSASRLRRWADGPRSADAASTGGRACLCSRSATRANRCACSCGAPAPRSGPSSTSAPFAGWAGRSA